MPSDPLLHQRLSALNLAVKAREGDAFQITNGNLTGFVGEERSSLLELNRALILHRADWRRKEPEPRQSFGVEIGAGVAKLFVKQWTLNWKAESPLGSAPWVGRTIVDVKIRLVKRADMNDPDVDYRRQILWILDTFMVGGGSEWLIPAANFDFIRPERLLERCPPDADIAYLYGTQGPREAAASGGPLFAQEMRIISGDEEGLLIFNAIVPEPHRGGTMAIEVGSGSTELALVGAGGRKYAITFALGGQHQRGLAEIVRGIKAGDIVKHAGAFLVSERSAAEEFMAQASHYFGRGKRAVGLLYINPNEDSADMRARAERIGTGAPGMRAPIGVKSIARYADENRAAPFGGKALIIARLAEAFAFDAVLEGAKGGLKEGMAQFIGEALAKAATEDEGEDDAEHPRLGRFNEGEQHYGEHGSGKPG